MDVKRILVIEDEKPIAEILKYGFEKEGFSVDCAYTGGSGLERAAQCRPDMVLLDWMLPDLSGVDVCRMLTDRYNIPIIMLTARSNVEDKLYGLECGADDYITKPFDLREVVARVRTILRRFERARGFRAEAESEVRTYEQQEKAEGLQIVEQERMVYRDGEEIDLTPKEYDLLVYFWKHPRQVFTRELLLEQIWGYDFMGDTRTVDIHVQRLRKKAGLEKALATVFGVGYKYVP